MKTPLYFFLFTFLLLGCQEDEVDPSVSFTKIYDSFRSDQSYNPIDIVETAEGFLIVAAQGLDNEQYMGTQLIELDEFGDFVSEEILPDNTVIPVGDFMTVGNSHYFLAMDGRDSTTAKLIIASDSAAGYSETLLTGGISFPLAASVTSGGQILVLSYDDENESTILSLHGTDGVRQNSIPFSIGAGADSEEVVQSIREHYTDPERSSLPFFCGEISDGSYFLSGFYEYNLSVLFTDLDDLTGQIQGQRSDGGFTDMMHLTGNTFSMFGYQYNDNFILPNEEVDINAISSSPNFLDVPFSEYRSRTPADIVAYETEDGTSYSIIAAETQSRQIAINIFEAATGASAGVIRVGNINPYSLSSIKVDSENNLLVLGSTLVSGRFSRVFFRKISEKEILNVIE